MKRIKELHSENQDNEEIQARPESQGIASSNPGVSCATDNLESKCPGFHN